jgi:hypothetical protein
VKTSLTESVAGRCYRRLVPVANELEPEPSSAPEPDESLDPQTDSWAQVKAVSRWAVANPITFVTLVGLLLYGVLRFSSSLFYGRLGFTPEEVGLSYVSTIGRAVYGLMTLGALYFVIRLVLEPAVMWSFGHMRNVWRRPNRLEPIPVSVTPHLKHAWNEIGSDFFSGFIILAFVLSPIFFVWDSVGEVQAGKPQEGGLIGGFRGRGMPRLTRVGSLMFS